MDLNKEELERMIRQILIEKLSAVGKTQNNLGFRKEKASGVISVKLPTVKVDESNRLDTGHCRDRVYTKDVLTLQESPRLGCGIMEMTATTFDWTLNYDEIDYVIEGSLSIIIDGEKVTANEGELIFIPKGSKIQFSVPKSARFIYVTYPADWANQA